ncbi:MAG: TolC family protein [Pirellulales bacterium]|nr:TolC family protein [Pirellulales bacterium]
MPSSWIKSITKSPRLPLATPGRYRFAWLQMLPLLGLLALATGCTRGMYRQQADKEVYAAVHEKTDDPRWPLQNYTIEIDPRSRMYDGFDPDKEPLPPDDPTSHELMHCVDGMRGYPCWHRNGDTPWAENPDWHRYLPSDEEGKLALDLPGSVLVGLMNSRDYQRELEDLYLSALDVTFERFRFDVQFFAGNDTFFTADGVQRPGSGGESRSTLTTDTGVQANKLFASGGQLMVELANSLVWQFSGTDSDSATTLLDFSLVQPLLRGGVRSRVLERLTLAERTLLANVRFMERYRRGFYVQLVTGRDAGQGPSRRGGVFGGAGLSGFTGLGGGFGNVATQGNINQQGGTGAAGGAGAGTAGGFMGLLQTQMQINNQEANIAALAESLAQLQAAYDAGRIDRFQVDFGRQALFNARSQLLTARTNFQNLQDNYKITLGLPPDIEISLCDPLLDAFQLIDPAIPPLQNRITRTQELLGERIISIRENLAGAAQPDKAAALRQNLAFLQAALATARQVHEQTTTHFKEVAADIGDVRAAFPERRQMLKSLQSRDRQQSNPDTAEQTALVDQTLEELTTPEPQPAGSTAEQGENLSGANSTTATNPQQSTTEPDEFDLVIADLEQLPDKLTVELKTLAQSFARYPELLRQLEQELSAWQADPSLLDTEAGQERAKFLLARLPYLLVELSGEILELSLIQARARAESVSLLPIEMDPADALAIASHNRRDWMNARASLVDTWRLIEFNANDLEADLNLIFGGDIRTVGDNPVDFRSATGRLRVGVQFDAPLTRVAERNNYRQSLIEFQQARRNYYAFVDRVSQSLRNGLRQMELNQANFELRRAAVRVAIDQVEVSRLRLREPPKPGVVSTYSPTTARDLVSSLSDLLNVQNDFMSVWVNYEVERLNLDFNLDTMELNERGLWIDPGSAVGHNGLECLRGGNWPDRSPWDQAWQEGRPKELQKPLPRRGDAHGSEQGHAEVDEADGVIQTAQAETAESPGKNEPPSPAPPRAGSW